MHMTATHEVDGAANAVIMFAQRKSRHANIDAKGHKQTSNICAS
jgi:hypothetical protein